MSQALVTAAVELAFEFFRRRFPVRPGRFAGPRLRAEERDLYHRWEMAAILPILTLWALLGYAWFIALNGAANRFCAAGPATLYQIRPSPALMVVPSCFLGMMASSIAVEWLYRCLLGDRYPRYVRACYERVEFDLKRVGAWLLLSLIAGSTVFFVITVRIFARFDANGVEVRRPLALRSTYYGYAHVRAIEHRATERAPNGNSISRPHYVVLFDDGTSVSTAALRDPVPETDRALAELVARKSGRPILEIP